MHFSSSLSVPNFPAQRCNNVCAEVADSINHHNSASSTQSNDSWHFELTPPTNMIAYEKFVNAYCFLIPFPNFSAQRCNNAYAQVSD